MAARGGSIGNVRILGAVHAVAGDGATVDLPSATQRRVLALLALASPRRIRTESLADRLGLTPASLRRTISRLRSVVGEDVVETSPTGYALVAEVDAARFRAAVADAAAAVGEDRLATLERALDWWSGPPLEEFANEEWAAAEVAQLVEIHAATVDDLAEALIDAGRSADAIAWLEDQVARHPLRDAARGLLVRALASGGRQAEALRAYQDYRTLLVEETGTEPSAAVVRIERRVATGWDGISATPDLASRSSQASPDATAPFPRPLRPAVGLLTNTASKVILAFAVGGRAFGTRFTLLLAAPFAATSTVLFLTLNA